MLWHEPWPLSVHWHCDMNVTLVYSNMLTWSMTMLSSGTVRNVTQMYSDTLAWPLTLIYNKTVTRNVTILCTIWHEAWPYYALYDMKYDHTMNYVTKSMTVLWTIWHEHDHTMHYMTWTMTILPTMWHEVRPHYALCKMKHDHTMHYVTRSMTILCIM